MEEPPHNQGWRSLRFHLLLNVGRIVSYALVGAAIGALGSVLLAGGQLAGIGSELRRVMSLVTGCLLIWFGLVQINPQLLPPVPLLNPMVQGSLHHRLSRVMMRLSETARWWTPILLGMAWGLIPCGFLYVAQLKAVGTGTWFNGFGTMLAFGIGTFPTMLGVGMLTTWLGRDRQSQLFRMGGWLTLIIGLLTLTRTGDTMVDVTGHAALLFLMLALAARPLQPLWPVLMRYRRALGVGAFVLSVLHTLHMLEHSWGWNWRAFEFMLPSHQIGILAGAIALGGMTPAALTSFDWAQVTLGRWWRRIHWLSVPSLVFCGIHCTLVGSHYLGSVQRTWFHYGCTMVLISAIVVILMIRGLSRRSPVKSSANSSEPLS
jgi:sulfite exporter TauE/SafE